MEMQKGIILPVVFKGNNYLLWSRTTKTVLRSRNLWKYVETSEDGKDEGDKEDGGVKKQQWEQEDQHVLAVLQSSLDPSILAAYSYSETAKELWITLKGVYGDMSNISRIFEVKKALNDLQQEGKSFKDLFGVFRSLWAELEMLRPPTIDPREMNERREQDQVFGLLLTLNDSYKGLIQHILRFDKLPTLNEVCQQIQKEEGSRSLFKPTSEMAHVAQRSQGYAEKKTLECDHCKMRGHTREKCWTLHPHLKPARLRGYGQSSSQGGGHGGQGQRNFAGAATLENDGVVKKSDFDALIKSLAKLAESGKSFLSSKLDTKLIIDSGASHNMVSDDRLLSNMEGCGGKVEIANGEKLPIEGIGTLRVFDKDTKALYVPGFATNLLSVHKVTKDLNCEALFGPKLVKFQDNETKEVIGVGEMKDGLYTVSKGGEGGMKCLAASRVGTSSLWHSRLGHPSQKVLRMILPNSTLPNKECEVCILGKQCSRVFSDSTTVYGNVFDVVHSDVWTAPCISKDQYKYFVSFIEHKSRYTWVTLINSKDQVFGAFQRFHKYVQNQYDANVKILRSDNGGEYMGNQFKTYIAENGIVHQTSCAYTPQQNGVSERKNRHLLEVARSIMFDRGVPKNFWGDAVMTACYLINRLPTSNLDKKSPFEVLNGTKPTIDHLKVFGCTCYVLVPGMQRSKLDPKSLKCIFVGYSSTQKGWKCYHPESRRIYVSREVKFNEEESYFNNMEWEEGEGITYQRIRNEEVLESVQINEDNLDNTNELHDNGYVEHEPHEVQESEDQEGSGSVSGDTEVLEHQGDEEDGMDNEGETEIHQEETQSPESIPILRRSKRIRFGPENWRNTRVYYNGVASAIPEEQKGSVHPPKMKKECFECTADHDSVPIGNNIPLSQNGMSTPHATRIRYPIENFCSITHLPKSSRAYLAEIDKEEVPTTYEEACKDQKWTQAMKEEMDSMKRNNTWDITELPKGKKKVGCRWVYTIKYKSTGEVERYKARLVAKGYTQVYGEDYTETFAPVAKLHSVRVVLSVAINLSWELWQMDVKNAFLQGDLEEEVFMAPPLGYEIETNKVCKLRKAIYGLKQSPRAWYQRLSQCLMEEEFIKSEADHTLFTKRGKDGVVVVLIYVDDIIITGDNKEGVKGTKEMLKTVFDIKDLGELRYFLGIEMNREPSGMFISQRKYVLDLLRETGKLATKPAKTPIEDGYQDVREEEAWADVKQYQRMVGKLIYLTITRPDISFAVNRISQHMQTPKKHHWQMVVRILRYLKGNPGKGVWLGCNGNTNIEAYCDADWAGDKLDRKSTTGYCTFVGGSLVTWRSKKQKVIALSSAEAEYRAMKEVTKEVVWLRKLLQDMGIQERTPTTLYCDNQAAIHIASNPVFHERTKHIEVDCHFVREKIQEGVISPKFIRSEDQMADMFTKAITLRVCEYLHCKIGLCDPHRPILRGSVEQTHQTKGKELEEQPRVYDKGECSYSVEIKQGEGNKMAGQLKDSRWERGSLGDTRTCGRL